MPRFGMAVATAAVTVPLLGFGAAPVAADAPPPSITSFEFVEDSIASGETPTILLNGGSSPVTHAGCRRLSIDDRLTVEYDASATDVIELSGDNSLSNPSAYPITMAFELWSVPCAAITEETAAPLGDAIVVGPALSFSRQGFNVGESASGTAVHFSTSAAEAALGLHDFDIRPLAECRYSYAEPTGAPLTTALPGGLTLVGGAGSGDDLALAGTARIPGDYTVCIRAYSTGGASYFGTYSLVIRGVLAETGADTATTATLLSLVSVLLGAGGALLMLRRRTERALDTE